MTKTPNKPKCNPNDKPHYIGEDVDLSLEVEIDDDVKDIINSPRKCASTLLDVTIIKPQEVEKLYTVQKKTLKGEDVKKFIAAINMDKKEMKKVINQILSSDDAHLKFHKHDVLSAGDYQKVDEVSGKNLFDKCNKLYSTDETNSEDNRLKNNENKVKQIYTTPKTFHDVNKMFECKNKRSNKKPDLPCTCENCAVVGIVDDSQKKPFATESLYDPREISFEEAKKRYEYEKRKKNSLKEDHTHCETYFRHLARRIRELEDRLSVQEERSVPKEYFKRIITKLVTHLTKLSGTYNNQTTSSKNKDYRRKDQAQSTKKSYENLKQRYNIHPVLVTPRATNNSPFFEVNLPKKKEVPPTTSAQPFWKWGEEILRPGIDIKNKIMVLLEDTMKNLRWNKDISRPVVDIKSTVENITGNLYKTVDDIPERDSRDYFKKKKATFCDSLMSVGLLNTTDWEESQMSLKYEISERDITKKPEAKIIQEYYKSEFLKIISNTKEEDRRKLWDSIWNQAASNKQTKKDTATIQLPGKKDVKCENVEIEYTLGELESLLLGKKR